MGYEVIVSYIGDDVIIRVSENVFDCVLLDINLLDINGLEVVKIMKEGYFDFLIIVFMVNVYRSDKEVLL